MEKRTKIYDSDDSSYYPAIKVTPKIEWPPEEINEYIAWLEELKKNFIKDEKTQTILINHTGTEFDDCGDEYAVASIQIYLVEDIPS